MDSDRHSRGGVRRGHTGYPIRFDAGGGDDRFADAIGDDSFDGGPGSDNMLRNDGGTDTCIDVEVGIANCETVNP